MSTPSAIPATIDALVALFTTSLAGTVAVYDGAAMTDARDTARLYVGATDPLADDFDQAAESEQGWAWLGHNQRDETLSVHCEIWTWDPNASMKAARDAAYRALQAATDALQADPAFSGSGLLYSLGVTTSGLFQIQDKDGAKVRLPFVLECRARLS